MKYETKLVWYAPDTSEIVASMAFWRTYTMHKIRTLNHSQTWSPDVHDLPVRMVVSTDAAKSVKTASTSSSPAKTVMISALGFVYRFESTPARNTVKV